MNLHEFVGLFHEPPYSGVCLERGRLIWSILFPRLVLEMDASGVEGYAIRMKPYREEVKLLPSRRLVSSEVLDRRRRGNLTREGEGETSLRL